MDQPAVGRRFPLTWLCKGDEAYGVGRDIVAVSDALRRRGWPVGVICGRHGRTRDQLLAAGVRVHDVGLQSDAAPYRGGLIGKARSYLVNRRAVADDAARLAGVLRSVGGRHLHVRWPDQLFAAAGAAGRVGGACYWGMPNFVGVHDRRRLHLGRFLLRRTCRRHDVRVLANSDATGRTLAGGGVTPVTLYPATRGADFTPDPEREAGWRAGHGVPPEAALLVIAARLVPDKGGMHLLRAAIRHGRTPSGRPLWVALPGDGPTDYRAALQREAATAGWGRRLVLPGRVADVRPWYAMADVTANLRQEPEPFGLSVVESMLMRRPVLVHALGGPAETVVDGATGWHLGDMRQGTVDAGLGRALDDEPRWPAMGGAARGRALDRFSDEAVADRYEAMLLADPLARPPDGA